MESYQESYQVKTMPNRTVAIILAFFLGGLGAHKFYLGKPKTGLIYLLFCWTLVPAIIAFVEALMYAFMSDVDFVMKYGVLEVKQGPPERQTSTV